MKYRTFRTTMGRKYRVRMTDDELAERELFNIILVLVPFLSTVLLMAVWLWRG
jgi:hypothetical protein